jgi:2-oxoisovalerate dehydrogenase E1 component alpha subunit
MLQILRPDGTMTADAPIDVARTRSLFEAMLTARRYDEKATSMQKQGRLATYAPFRGQEAAQVGSAAALRSGDWMVGTYRDAAAMWTHGYGWELLLLGRMGDERGGAAPAGVSVLPPSITVGAHMLHAVGLAWAARLQGSDRVAITYFGDGATSEGDFHEAMNFASVFTTGTVFFCQNNGYAISMPVERQSGSATIAQKADGYGMPGVRVDGNDLFAVYAATEQAVARAAGGLGPTLIEAVTYRMGPHTTTDDPARYRTRDEEGSWAGRDPLDRVRRYLESEDAWDRTAEAEVLQRASEEIETAVERAESLAPMAADDIFAATFEDLTPELAEQRGRLETE